VRNILDEYAHALQLLQDQHGVTILPLETPAMCFKDVQTLRDFLLDLLFAEVRWKDRRFTRRTRRGSEDGLHHALSVIVAVSNAIAAVKDTHAKAVRTGRTPAKKGSSSARKSKIPTKVSVCLPYLPSL
jgi:hypothetical protein